MIEIQRKRLANWLTGNIDLTITLSGIAVILVEKQYEEHIRLEMPSTNIEFWTLFLGIVVLSIGMSSLVCYRILFKWNKFLGYPK